MIRFEVNNLSLTLRATVYGNSFPCKIEAISLILFNYIPNYREPFLQQCRFYYCPPFSLDIDLIHELGHLVLLVSTCSSLPQFIQKLFVLLFYITSKVYTFPLIIIFTLHESMRGISDSLRPVYDKLILLSRLFPC